MLREAAAEFEQITPDARPYPDVLEAQMEIYRRIGRWDAVETIGRFLATHYPENAKWHLDLAEFFWDDCRCTEARDVLAAVQDRFIDHAEFQYRLAGYESALGRYAEAQRNLDRAYELDSSTRQRSAADSEFVGFW